MTDELHEEEAEAPVKSEQPDTEAASQPRIGGRLRAAREKLGLSIEDASASLKFAPRQIEALESDNYAQLPEMTFVRGFVRSYARLLHIDPEPLLAELPGRSDQNIRSAASIPQQDKLDAPFPTVYSERKLNIIWLLAALLVAILLAIGVWVMRGTPTGIDEEQTQTDSSDTVVVQPLQTPEPVPIDDIAAPAAEPAPAAAVNGQVSKEQRPRGAIHMTFDADSWVEITDGNGDVQISRINPQGSVLDLNGTAPFSLVIGEAKNVHLTYKGKPIDLAPYIRVEVARLTLE